MTDTPTQQATHTRWSDLPVEPLNPRLGRQFVVGTAMMLSRLTFKAGAHVPPHSHANEQITCVLQGSLLFTVGDRQMTVGAGEVLCIPPHLPHEALALEDTVTLDLFHPPRQDWIDGTDAYLRQEVAAG